MIARMRMLRAARGRNLTRLLASYGPSWISRTARSAAARQRNVAGAFDIRPEVACDIADAHIVLIDDVLTTGATLSACARVLKKGGAASVDALVLARVMRSGEAI